MQNSEAQRNITRLGRDEQSNVASSSGEQQASAVILIYITIPLFCVKRVRAGECLGHIRHSGCWGLAFHPAYVRILLDSYWKETNRVLRGMESSLYKLLQSAYFIFGIQSPEPNYLKMRVTCYQSP